MSGATLQPNGKETRRHMFLNCLRIVSKALLFTCTWPQNAHRRNILLTNWSYLLLSPNAFHVSCPNGREKWADAIGATKQSPASAGVPGAPMPAAEPGNANTFGDLLVRPLNVAQNFAALNQAVLLNAEIAK
jgi:hypothetical protein